MGLWLEHSAALLRGTPGLASRNPREAQHIVARALNRHATLWGQGPVDTALHRVAVGDISVILLRYGAPVKIEPLRPGTYYVVQIPLGGRAQIRSAGTRLEVDPENGAVLSPNVRVVLEWASHCEQILLKIPVATVERVWRSVSDRPLRRAPEFELPFRSDDAAGSGLMQCVEYALRQAAAMPDTQLGQSVIQRLEDLIVLKLLDAQPHSHSDELARRRDGIAPRHVRAAEQFMLDHLHEPISLADVAAHAGVSVRTLNQVFRDFRRTSPIAELRELRLERARAALSAAGPETRVADVARQLGFRHLGRFAVSYRMRYGEAPSETLARGTPATRVPR
jgi:AraC-like DNA-binding protein